MVDPLSISASTAGLLSLGIGVTKGLIDFYTTYKHREAKVAHTLNHLSSLLGTLNNLQEHVLKRKFTPSEEASRNRIEDCLSDCNEAIKELKEELDKLQRKPAGDVSGKAIVVARRVAYPFRQSTLTKLGEEIQEAQQNLSLALDVLQLRHNETIQDGVRGLKSDLGNIRTTQIQSSVRDWLKAPDPSINHNAACEKHQPGTGQWLVDSTVFDAWQNKEQSFLWLNGFAGCGKTLLCSTAIQYTLRRRARDSSVAVAMFYFSFSDGTKRDELALLRSLLLQFASQCPNGHELLSRLQESHCSGDIPKRVMIDHLQYMIKGFSESYILLDALDENTRYIQRDKVLEIVNIMRCWSSINLHLLVTSRDEPDIRESLDPATGQELILKGPEVDKDINLYISEKLKTDPSLQKWKPHLETIQKDLADRAHGVFRWVECQFEALKRCPRSEYRLKLCLNSLPRDLDETYERMLDSIDPESAEDARRILTFLCYSTQQLTVAQLNEVIAVELTRRRGINPDRRFNDTDSLLQICPGLISFVERTSTEWNVLYWSRFSSEDIDENEYLDGITPRRTPIFTDEDHGKSMTEKNVKRRKHDTMVQIAHFSVQEYLQSERILNSRAARYALSPPMANFDITQIYCTYLLDEKLSKGKIDAKQIQLYPLAQVAAQDWSHHYKNSGENRDLLNKLIFKLLDEQNNGFRTLVMLCLHSVILRLPGLLDCDFSETASPLFLVSFLGIEPIVKEILSSKTHQKNAKNSVNYICPHWGTALQAACYHAHKNTVQTLLSAGADVNMPPGRYGTALEAASKAGHVEVVRMLLDLGAGSDATKFKDYRALRGAVSIGHSVITRMLVDAGTKSDGERLFDYALQEASRQGNTDTIEMLLNNPIGRISQILLRSLN